MNEERRGQGQVDRGEGFGGAEIFAYKVKVAEGGG